MSKLNIKDITADGDQMVDQMDIDSDVRENVRQKLDDAMEMLSQEGVDPATAIMNMIGINDDPMGMKESEEGEAEPATQGMDPRKKAVIVAILRKKRP